MKYYYQVDSEGWISENLSTDKKEVVERAKLHLESAEDMWRNVEWIDIFEIDTDTQSQKVVETYYR